MPIQDFGHYSIALGYVDLYYAIGNKEKARKNAELLIELFKEKLRWYSTFDERYNNIIVDEIENILYMYKIGVLDSVESADPDLAYNKKLQGEFMETIKLFEHLIAEEE